MIVDFKPAAPEGSQNVSPDERHASSDYPLQSTSWSQSGSSRGETVAQPSVTSVARPSQTSQIPESSPPEYEYPASGSHTPVIAPVPATYIPPARVLTTSPYTPPENDWEVVLRELQRNLSDLDAVRQSRGYRTNNRTARLIHVLFSDVSFLGADSGLGRRADLEWQETSNQMYIQEELVLNGMRKLARLHPNEVDRRAWNIRADKFERSMKANADYHTSWTNLPLVIMSEKLGILGRKKESSIEGLLKGILILIFVPLAALYGSFYLVGACFCAVRKILSGIFHVLTLGWLK